MASRPRIHRKLYYNVIESKKRQLPGTFITYEPYFKSIINMSIFDHRLNMLLSLYAADPPMAVLLTYHNYM